MNRLITASAGALSLTLGLLALPAASHSLAAQTRSVRPAHKGKSAKGTSVTVKGPKMLNWHTITGKGTAKNYPKASTVTVSVSRDLTNQMVHVNWTGFTPTNLQGGSPFYQYQFSLYPVEIVECRGAHPTKVTQCWQATNYQEQFGSNSNAVYSTTSNAGTGTADFQVQNSLQNSFLGCDSKHACSLVVVPSQGGLGTNCANHSQDDEQALGITTFGGSSDKCAWAKRIVVPLKFGPVLPCGTIRNPDLRIAGSPLMVDAMAQWDTGLCRQANPITVAWNPSVGEPTAIQETVIDNLADVALTTNPAKSVVEGSRRYTYAPIGVTAAALAYWFDDPNDGQPYTNIKLDPRLVAKLLTTSYTDYSLQCSPNTTAPCDKAVNGNAPDLFSDREFRQLNRKVEEPNDAIAEGLGDVPIVSGGQSDITYEITRWIEGNSAAAAFLKGHKDPWGMHVNTHYKGVKYPLNIFTGRDSSFLLQAAYTPVATLNFVTTAMLLGQPPGSNGFQPVVTGCPPNQQCFNPLAGESRGQRSLFGITDEADAATFLFPTAAILNGAGQYVTPSAASMAAALKSMTTAKNGITQQVNLNSKNKAAYPLTMVVYALVPIAGVDHSKAEKISRWLNYVTGPGQTKGELPGRLPFGYLPLPASMRAEAQHVATEVLDQSGTTSSPTPTPTPTDTSTATPTPTGGEGDPGTSPIDTSSGSPTASPTTSVPFPTATPTISTIALNSPATAGMARYALPALLVLAGLAALLGASIGAAATGPGTAAERLRRLLGQGPARGSK